MKTSSAKAKGRRLAQLVRAKLLKQYGDDEDSTNVVVTPSGINGPDLQLHGDFANMPYVFECKNQEKVNLWASWEQAQSHVKKETQIPVLVIGRNRTKPIVVLDLDDFIRIC